MNDIILLKNGDEFVFNKIYQNLHKKLYHYILSKTGSLYYAEEVTQITFLKLWKGRHNLNDQINLEIQIFRIAKTTMIDHFRQSSGYQKMQNLLSEKMQKSADFNNGIKNLQKKEILYKVQKTLALLPPMQRKVFELSRIYHLTHKEIANQQSISLKTVESHINQAIKKIKSTFLILIYFLVT